ncbi:TonB family protein [Oleiharenicola sp. Vm1]|uniref:TonB family protein n=1 Tax=Oleiharenicola sp. Vm1 TaxID=3398393 RepID=UPI0039F5A160
MRFALAVLILGLGVAHAMAQGVIPSYGTRVDIRYRAVMGEFPTEEKVVPPAYPALMRRASLEDTVAFTLTVKADGSVAEVAVGEAKSPEFRATVLETLPTWRFRPLATKPNAVKLRGEIRFRIIED